MAVYSPSKAGRREWLALAALALPTFLVAIDVFVLMLALPELSEDLGADSNQQLWITDIYGFLLAGFTLVMGTLGDRIGRRKLLFIGAIAFALLSLLAAWSTSPVMLILSRALLGIAGATLMPSTLSLITNIFQDEKQRATAFGLWGGTFTLGMIVGPILGGVLLAHFWWGSVFLIPVPLLLAFLVVGPKVLPEYRNGQPGKVDPTSVVLSLAMMLPIIYGIKELARAGWEPLAVVGLVGGLAAGVAFVRRQGRLSDPVLDVSLFRSRKLSVSLVSMLSYSTVGGGMMLFMMLYFQLVHGLTSLASGVAMIPGMIAATVGFATVPKLATKFRPAYVVAAGMSGVALMLALFGTLRADSGLATLIVGFAVLSYCGSAVVSIGMNLVVGSAPAEKAGSAGSLAQMSNEFGGTLGAAVFGTLGYAIYRTQVQDSIPAALPPGAEAAARDSFPGAVGVSADLPPDVASALLDPARVAFTQGLNTVAIVGAAAIAVAAVLMATLLKSIPPVGQDADRAAEPTDETVEERVREAA